MSDNSPVYADAKPLVLTTCDPGEFAWLNEARLKEAQSGLEDSQKDLSLRSKQYETNAYVDAERYRSAVTLANARGITAEETPFKKFLRDPKVRLEDNKAYTLSCVPVPYQVPGGETVFNCVQPTLADAAYGLALAGLNETQVCYIKTNEGLLSYMSPGYVFNKGVYEAAFAAETLPLEFHPSELRQECDGVQGPREIREHATEQGWTTLFEGSPAEGLRLVAILDKAGLQDAHTFLRPVMAERKVDDGKPGSLEFPKKDLWTPEHNEIGHRRTFVINPGAIATQLEKQKLAPNIFWARVFTSLVKLRESQQQANGLRAEFVAGAVRQAVAKHLEVDLLPPTPAEAVGLSPEQSARDEDKYIITVGMPEDVIMALMMELNGKGKGITRIELGESKFYTLSLPKEVGLLSHVYNALNNIYSVLPEESVSKRAVAITFERLNMEIAKVKQDKVTDDSMGIQAWQKDFSIEQAALQEKLQYMNIGVFGGMIVMNVLQFMWQKKFSEKSMELQEKMLKSEDWKKRNILEEMTTDLHKQATEGKFDGLDDSLRGVEAQQAAEQLLSRQSIAMTGRAGVGKTTLGYILAKMIADGSLPALADVRLYELNMVKFTAGIKFIGTIEERVAALLEEFEKLKKEGITPVLLVDELHRLMSAGKSSEGGGIVEHLKPLLADGSLIVIGATTNREYFEYIATDNAMDQRFSRVDLAEPTPEQTFELMKKLKGKFLRGQKGKGLELKDMDITDEALRRLIFLSDKNMPESAFPRSPRRALLGIASYARTYDEHGERRTADGVKNATEITEAHINNWFARRKMAVDTMQTPAARTDYWKTTRADPEAFDGYVDGNIRELGEKFAQKAMARLPQDIRQAVAALDSAAREALMGQMRESVRIEIDNMQPAERRRLARLNPLKEGNFAGQLAEMLASELRSLPEVATALQSAQEALHRAREMAGLDHAREAAAAAAVAPEMAEPVGTSAPRATGESAPGGEAERARRIAELNARVREALAGLPSETEVGGEERVALLADRAKISSEVAREVLKRVAERGRSR